MRLALLAPDVVEAVLGDPLILDNLEPPLSASWEAQPDQLGCWTGEENRPSAGSMLCFAAIPRHRCAWLACPLPCLSAGWPEGDGHPHE